MSDPFSSLDLSDYLWDVFTFLLLDNSFLLPLDERFPNCFKFSLNFSNPIEEDLLEFDSFESVFSFSFYEDFLLEFWELGDLSLFIFLKVSTCKVLFKEFDFEPDF